MDIRFRNYTTYSLMAQITLSENLSKFQAQHLDHPYMIELQCTDCGQSKGAESCIRLREVPEWRRCGNCRRTSLVRVLGQTGRPVMQADSINGTYVPLIEIDFAGVRPIRYTPLGLWTALLMPGGYEVRDIEIGEPKQVGMATVTADLIHSYFRRENEDFDFEIPDGALAQLFQEPD